MGNKTSIVFKALLIFLFTLPASLYSGNFHFGITSAVKDKVEEIKEKREKAQLPSLATPSIIGVSSASGNVNITVVATNTVKVEFYVDGVLKATDTAEPYEFTLGTAQYSEGIHIIEAKAYNAENQTASTKTSITVTNNVSGDNPPTVTLTVPEDGSTVSGTVIVTADATDDKGVSKVEFYIDGVLMKTDAASPFDYGWDTTQYTLVGTHTVKAVAYDTVFQTASTQHSVITNNVSGDNPPTVTLTAPADGATVSGTVIVTADATDDKGLSKVEFYIDEVLKGTTNKSPYSFSWDTTNYAAGAHIVKAVAHDTVGQIVSDTHTVTLNNAGSIWTTELVATSWYGAGKTSIALDANNCPHILIAESLYRVAGLKYAKWTGTAWSVETIVEEDYRSDTQFDSPSIVVDSNSIPHISFGMAYSVITENGLKYGKWTGTSWNIETVDSNGIGGGLALDNNNNPYIAYYDATNNDLKYAKWTGTSWSIETVDSMGVVGLYPSLALDSNNNPHISYYDSTNKSIKYAKWTGTSWNIETIGVGGTDSSIALDSNSNPHISYCYYHEATAWDTSSALKYAKWTGTAWNIETIDDDDDPGGFTSYTGMYNSIALDSNNNPYISYFTMEKGSLKCAKWTGTAWSIETVSDKGAIGYGNSIAIDSNNHAHISYSGYGTSVGESEVVYKYATK